MRVNLLLFVVFLTFIVCLDFITFIALFAIAAIIAIVVFAVLVIMTYDATTIVPRTFLASEGHLLFGPQPVLAFLWIFRGLLV